MHDAAMHVRLNRRSHLRLAPALPHPTGAPSSHAITHCRDFSMHDKPSIKRQRLDFPGILCQVKCIADSVCRREIPLRGPGIFLVPYKSCSIAESRMKRDASAERHHLSKDQYRRTLRSSKYAGHTYHFRSNHDSAGWVTWTNQANNSILRLSTSCLPPCPPFSTLSELAELAEAL